MNGYFNLGDVVFSNWRLVRELGSGSYGTVYEAHREDDYGVYKSAIKIITIPKNQNELTSVRAMGMDDASATAYFKGFVDRVAQEFSLMARLQGNTNIVGYYDHDAIPHSNGMGWDVIIRMELLTPLLKHVVDHKMQNNDIVKMGIDICKALEICQKQNIIHRDIKPENIFVSEHKDYKLGDFGIARTLEATTGATKAGTYNYMAPEIYKELPYNMTVDIYSLGIVLYQLLNNGRTPFLPPYPTPIRYTDNDEALRLRMSGAKMTSPQNADEQLARIVLKACAYNPEERYTRPEQMRRELEEILHMMPPIDETQEQAQSTGESGYVPDTSAQISGGTVGMYGNREEPAAPGKSSGTVGMYGNREESVAPEKISGTVGMYGNREESAAPEKISGTVGMYGNREEPAAPEKISGTVGMYGNRDKPSGNVDRSTAQDKRPTERGRRKFSPWYAAAAGVAVVLLAIVFLIPHNTTPRTGLEEVEKEKIAENGEETTAAQPDEPKLESNEEIIEPEWSEWSDTLPEDVTYKESAIESRLQYRSTPLVQVINGPSPDENYTQFGDVEEISGYGSWKESRNGPVQSNAWTETSTKKSSAGSWSEWSASKQTTDKNNIPQNSSTMQVEILATIGTGSSTTWLYRTRTKSGGSGEKHYYYRTRQVALYFYDDSAWSEYSDEVIPQDGSVLVSTKKQYRYTTSGERLHLMPDMKNFPRFTDNTAKRYRDVDDSAWYGASNSTCLRTAEYMGLLLPDEYMRFAPDQAVTLGQTIRAAALIDRIYQGYSGLMCEIDDNDQPYIDYAIERGIIQQDEFEDMDAEANRQIFAHILSRALPKEEIQARRAIDGIDDMEAGTLYDSTLAVVCAGVMDLDWENHFNPMDAVTRAQAASIMERLVYPEYRVG